jgi:hypothetical protein
MQFLAEDVAAAHKPSTAELKAWFDKNSNKFALPSRYSVRHLYFSPDKRALDRASASLTNSYLRSCRGSFSGYELRQKKIRRKETSRVLGRMYGTGLAGAFHTCNCSR